MKLTKKNLPEAWKAVCKFMYVKTGMYVEQHGIISACSSNSKTDHMWPLHNINGSFVTLDNKVWKLYCDDNTWTINKAMLIDDFAYHIKQDVYDIKADVLRNVIRSLKAGIEIIGTTFKASSLEEIMMKNDMEIAS